MAHLATESFFHSPKVEKLHEGREEAKAEVVAYIEIYYNLVRRHSTLGYLSPREFKRREAV
jgi:putative transposase